VSKGSRINVNFADFWSERWESNPRPKFGRPSSIFEVRKPHAATLQPSLPRVWRRNDLILQVLSLSSTFLFEGIRVYVESQVKAHRKLRDRSNDGRNFEPC
jgi:hypothetical protein